MSMKGGLVVAYTRSTHDSGGRRGNHTEDIWGGRLQCQLMNSRQGQSVDSVSASFGSGDSSESSAQDINYAARLKGPAGPVGHAWLQYWRLEPKLSCSR